MSPEGFCYWLKGYLSVVCDDAIETELNKVLDELELKNKRFIYVPPSKKELNELETMLQNGPVGTWDEFDSLPKNKEEQDWINAGAENWPCGGSITANNWPPKWTEEVWKKK